MDFVKIQQRNLRNGIVEIYPNFIVGKTRDLMTRAKTFYAVWDEERRLWSREIADVQRLVDEELLEYTEKFRSTIPDQKVRTLWLSDFTSKSWVQFNSYLSQMFDNYKELDNTIVFQNTNVRKTDYVSRKLPYSLEEGEFPAYDELMSTLYLPEERAKLEWAIGSIVAGDSKNIQKFIVLFGAGGTGKSTFLNILQDMFDGYFTVFEAKELTGWSNAFATEAFRSNPLIAIQHDGDLSRIEDNSKLNSIVSHELITMNEKYKPSYMSRANALLFMATNQPVKITGSNSGIIRRLIDVHPTGNTFAPTKYHNLMNQIPFEHGAIAYHCLQVYEKMGKNYYSSYKPLDMQERTDVFYNFVETNYYTILEQGGVSLSQAWALYKDFCEESALPYKMPKYKFKAELKDYFDEFTEDGQIDGKHVRNFYKDLRTDMFKDLKPVLESPPGWLVLDQTESIFDKLAEDYPAQYATTDERGIPKTAWSRIKTTLADIDTSKLHYVKVPTNHIVVDFDIRDADGKKSAEANLEAASKWPPTYGEFSKSKAGIHLHYIWADDATELSRLYDEGIEVKVFVGDAALRRQLSYCNQFPIATLSDGIPKKEPKVINMDSVKSEQSLRELIKRNLRKEIHPGTKPSIDFIYKILEDAYSSGLHYDVTDMRQVVLAFAMHSTNQAQYCVKLVNKMHFSSEDHSDPGTEDYIDDRLVFFDVEVFKNLLIVNWKYEGKDVPPVHMINPGPQDIEKLFSYKLVGFNNRRYDNHILYARFLGYDNEQIFNLSAAIINGGQRGLFGEAYNISYADVYDFSSKKQSLKKFQLDLGIHHQELPFPWDEPLAEENWPLAIEYCDNDVIATEEVFNDRHEDFVARQILAELSGLTVNDSTQSHTARIIFGRDPTPQSKFIYTDLSETFKGYTFESGKSSYRGEDPGEGGYVYAEPGFYRDVALLDIASMHPTSIRELNLFGPYTEKYAEIIDARLAIKHKDFESAGKMLNGVLVPYLDNVENADALAYALKIIINIVYGLTSARFANKFKDPRNIDNIVAKRGALFMIDLKHAVQEKGFTVAHIKTDSIKVPEPTKTLIKFITEFGEKYGYTFEHEATYDRFCLVNDAVYIARDMADKHWTATGAEFARPYIFKTLFSKEPIEFRDLCEDKTVTTALYLDMNEGLGEDDHNYVFVGKAGSFCPIEPGKGGGLLLREKGGKYYAATGTKGWRWLQSEDVLALKKEGDIDQSYFRKLVDDAIAHIEEYIPFDQFVQD